MTGPDTPPPFERINPHRLYRNPGKGKLFGVCAGLADYFGIDPLPVRIGSVLGLIFFSGPVVIAYLIAALALKPRPETLYRDKAEETFWRAVSNKPEQTLSGLRHKFRDLERRLGGMEAYVTSAEFELNRAINDLERRESQPRDRVD